MNVSMFAPERERCGIGDYTRLLVSELRRLPEIADVHSVAAPEYAPQPFGETVRHYRAEEARYARLGDAMNRNADLAHVQHQYFFFGGVAPHKNHAAAFYRRVKVPLVVTVHEIAAEKPRTSGALRLLLKWSSRRNFADNNIRRLIVHTAADRDRLTAMGIPEPRITQITHGIPPALPMPSAEEAKQYLGLTGKRVLTLFGFLSSKKGHLGALQALWRLPEDVFLLFAGDKHPDDHSTYAAHLRGWAAYMKMEDRVRITGYIAEAELPMVMAATDIALAPYLESSGSGSLANLFAYGRAIVASAIAPHVEIAREPPTPMTLFQNGNAADLAARISELLNDAERRSRLQAAALAYAARHSYAQMAQETLAVYQSILAEEK